MCPTAITSSATAGGGLSKDLSSEKSGKELRLDIFESFSIVSNKLASNSS